MSTYVWGSSLPYRDYLQAQSFAQDLAFTLDRNTREIIASNEELQRAHIAVSGKLVATVADGFENLHFDLQEVSRGLETLNASFQWGFSNLLTGVGRLNDTLDQLLSAIRSPERTWAYEQFQIARDAYSRHLYEEAADYVDRAINGYKNNSGYALEYRFHYLLGSIRLGDVRNTSNDIVNLEEAESYFAQAARYAGGDQPMDAARAFLAAGWAAYCQGNFSKANDHTRQAILVTNGFSEAHFQLAKILMHVGEPDRALPSLRQAIELDRRYTIKAAGDDDFMHHKEKIVSLIESLRAEAGMRLNAEEAELKERLHEMSGRVARYSAHLHCVVNIDVGALERTAAGVSSIARSETYFGYLDALLLCEKAKRQLDAVAADLRSRVAQEVRGQMEGISGSAKRKADAASARWRNFGTVAAILIILIGAGSGHFMLSVGVAVVIALASIAGFKNEKARIFSKLDGQRSLLEKIKNGEY